MDSKTLALAKDLISQPSYEGNFEAISACFEIIEQELQGFTIERFERNGHNSILVYKEATRPKQFKVILNGHVDVVPGKSGSYLPTVNGDKLYGTGSLDMKTNLATMVIVFAEMSRNVSYPLALQIVSDEEIGGFDGTGLQVEKGVRADLVIAGETTQFNIAHKAKGIIWAKIVTRGKMAHGAYPWNGENAVWKMNTILDRLHDSFKHPKKDEWVSTINPAIISTPNTALNSIPDKCELSIDVRYIPEDSENIINVLENAVSHLGELSIIVHEPAMHTDENDNLIKALKTVSCEIIGSDILLYGANGSSDARHYVKSGCAGIEFGPIGGGIGTDEEWTSLEGQKKYKAILHTFLMQINTQG